MTNSSPQEVTQLLLAWRNGDQAALEKLTPLVYNELCRIAHRYMRRERPGHLLQTKALVNEAYVRLIDGNGVNWQNRLHFFAVCARIMRFILINAARDKRPQVSIVEIRERPKKWRVDLIALADSLRALEAIDFRKSRVIELRFFGGLTVEQTAEVLEIAPITVMREWKEGKAWLRREMTGRT